MKVSKCWKPTFPQKMILQRTEDELFFDGGVGAGKTEVGIRWMIEQKYANNELYRGLVILKDLAGLLIWVKRAIDIYQNMGAILVGSPQEPPNIRFPSGAQIITGHLKRQDLFEELSGCECQKILIEGVSEIPQEEDYEKIISVCRSSLSGVEAQVLVIDDRKEKEVEGWLKERWIDAAKMKLYMDPGTKRSRMYIPANMDINNPWIR